MWKKTSRNIYYYKVEGKVENLTSDDDDDKQYEIRMTSQSVFCRRGGEEGKAQESISSFETDCKGKGWKKATLKWITTNLSQQQAGLILRTLRDEESKTRWTIQLPERSFLGQNQVEYKALRNQMLNEAFRLS